MKDALLTLLLLPVVLISHSQGQEKNTYGDNEVAGQTISINGINQYFEVYGKGEPLLLIHGAGQSIEAMTAQIDYFKDKYKVIVPDCRGFGKTKNGKAKLTYELSAKDMSALLDHLKLDSALIVGWSNGGIIGLIMAMEYPDKVKKLAAMGANITADTIAVEKYAADVVYGQMAYVDDMIEKKNADQDWALLRQQIGLLAEQPHINPKLLGKIKCPVIVMAGDKDVIRTTHSLLIFNNIDKAHLCIFPGATHYIPMENPDLFNNTVENFLATKFTRPDTKDHFVK